ncbi:MAG TPA: long-chain fatty acid--CoA ligase [Pyrinomonadaceae bacterium]|jgi:long-chain acyl-CoA synthetase|nr:long-chain fatty acid--CoA ligase [Pyrinomonadaceae bacterium]
MNYPNIYALFCERTRQYRGENVFYFRRDGAWVGISWEQFEREAHEFASALLMMKLTPGASVCVLMGNVPEWPVCDVGTIMAGGCGVGLYPTNSAEQCEYIINHADAEVVVVDTPQQLEKILRVRARLPKVKTIIVLDESAADRNQGVLSYQDFLKFGAEKRVEVQSLLLERAEGARADDTAVMVYTSGTTGTPKGACLSHRYIINSVESLRATIPIYDTDVAFSYLPYCHVAERISGLYNRLYAGAAAYFVDDISKLWEYMLELKPTVFASLPRFFEKVHARVVSDLEQASKEEQRAFNDALETGRRVSRLKQARTPVPADLQTEYNERARPVLSRVNDYFGGRLRLATSGGAPLLTEVAEFFDAAGLPILQAFGLTENICVAFNRPDNYKFGTVGPPMPGCEVRIAPDGEILVRSEMMFSGYYKEPDKTAEVISDGWLLTGDLGETDAEGFLKITGRKKELIVTSTGKKIAPAMIENLLKEHHLISHALVFGEGKSYLVALITLNQLEAEAYARTHSIAHEDFADLTRRAGIQDLVNRIVEGVNARVSSTEAIRKFLVLDHDFQVERDEVTPTLKLKRAVVTERYQDLLQSLYS